MGASVSAEACDGTPAGRWAKAFPDPLAAPVLLVTMGGHEGYPDLCPWSFYQRHGEAWTPRGWGGPCAMFGGFSGAVGGLAEGILSHVQYLCFFLDVYLPKHLFMQ